MRVNITDEASEQVEQIADYLEFEWSPRVRENFFQKLTHAIQIISEMPFAFPESEQHPGLRRCVFQKLTSIYYQVKNDEIDILAVVDNRRDY